MIHSNAIPDRAGTNAFEDDPDFEALLKLYLEPELFRHLLPHFRRLGALVGGPMEAWARDADLNPPVLQHRSRRGIDQQSVIKHPSYVEMERIAFEEFGLAAMSHRGGVMGWPQPMPAVVKYALSYLFVQAEFGLCCPLSMTDSLTRTLRKFGAPALVERYLEELTAQDLDSLAQGAMFMTEQGAGSDVAATETRAQLDLEAHGQASAALAEHPAWRIFGDKWFCSNPDAALAMVLARSEPNESGMRGVSLFLLPKILPDGSRNHYRIVRLKDKLGTRSMASGEIQFEGARAWLVGERGRGFVQMADMVNNSRLSNGMRAAGMMRRAASEALFIARHRQAFGKRLIDMPLMQKQLAKILMATEEARSMMFQAAECLRRSDAGDKDAYALTRLLTPLIKFRACRDARKVTGDAMEVRGGCGYIEEWGDARVLRDAHLGSIWEGTSNIVALDVMRAIQRENSLPIWQNHLSTLLASSNFSEENIQLVGELIQRASSFALNASSKGSEALARQAASALYHLTAAVVMSWEAKQMGSARRQILANLVLTHKLTARDPLLEAKEPSLSPLFE
jgi:acyl-CoA dehydrogenase